MQIWMRPRNNKSRYQIMDSAIHTVNRSSNILQTAHQQPEQQQPLQQSLRKSSKFLSQQQYNRNNQLQSSLIERPTTKGYPEQQSHCYTCNQLPTQYHLSPINQPLPRHMMSQPLTPIPDLMTNTSSTIVYPAQHHHQSSPTNVKHHAIHHNQLMSDLDNIEFYHDHNKATAKYDRGRSSRQSKQYDGPHVKWSRKNIAVTMERYQPISSPTSPSGSSSGASHQEYSYAYYEPGAIMCHSNIPTPEGIAGPSMMTASTSTINSGSGSGSNSAAGAATSPTHSIKAMLLKTKEKQQQLQQQMMHKQQYHRTNENIYEDVIDDKNQRLVSSEQSLADRGCTKTEFQHILNNHYRVLEELNLSVEELLMSTTPPPTPLTVVTKRRNFVDNLSSKLSAMTLKDDMRSPVCDFVEDSGFSGSSSGASYIGSLRNYKTAITRSLRRSSGPTCSPSSSCGTISSQCRQASSKNEPLFGTPSASSLSVGVHHNDTSDLMKFRTVSGACVGPSIQSVGGSGLKFALRNKQPR